MIATARWFAGLVAVLLLAQPAAAAPAPSIVGGQPASIAAHPWMVALVDGTGYPFCDGTLTSATTVVTAAHCLLGRTAADVQVVGGRSDLSQITPGDHVSGVTGVSVPAGFVAPQQGDDIATLTLVSPMPYRPLPLATAADYPAGTVGTVLGWGDVAGGAETTVLHQAQVPVVADPACQAVFDRYVEGARYAAAAMFCAGGRGPGICTDDDGGPLVIDGTLAGIVSWSVGCGQHPDFYTRVADYPPSPGGSAAVPGSTGV
jgi:secreted trypsin-like serine protease